MSWGRLEALKERVARRKIRKESWSEMNGKEGREGKEGRKVRE